MKKRVSFVFIYSFSFVLALSCLLFLFIGGPVEDVSRISEHFWDLGHIVCFALWTWLYIQWRPKSGYWRQFSILMGLTLIFGGLTELIQGQLPTDAGRVGSWADLQKDLLGCLLVLLFLSTGRWELKRGLLFSLQFLALLGTFWCLLPLMSVAVDNFIAQREFPLLSGFEQALEIDRWEGNSQRELVESIVFSGEKALQVQFNTDQSSGVTLSHFPADWSEYRKLSMAVYNPDFEHLSLNLRIHDQKHRQSKYSYSDRFNTRFILKQGWTQINISLDEVACAPKGRRMEMSRITQVQLFTVELSQPRTLIIDDVKLLR